MFISVSCKLNNIHTICQSLSCKFLNNKLLLIIYIKILYFGAVPATPLKCSGNPRGRDPQFGNRRVTE